MNYEYSNFSIYSDCDSNRNLLFGIISWCMDFCQTFGRRNGGEGGDNNGGEGGDNNGGGNNGGGNNNPPGELEE